MGIWAASGQPARLAQRRGGDNHQSSIGDQGLHGDGEFSLRLPACSGEIGGGRQRKR